MLHAFRRARSALVAALLAALAAAGAPAFAITASEARTRSFKLQSEGLKLYHDGRYQEAIADFQQVVNIHLNSFMAWYYLGASLAAVRRYGEAVEPLKIALDLEPGYVQAHLALGDAYLKLGETNEARASYLRALELQPNYAAGYDGLGRLEESLGHDDDAEADYRKALEINVAFADAYTHLGEMYLRRERLEDAVALFLKAISVRPEFSQAFTRLGVALARQRRYDDALAAAARSRALAPHDPEPLVTLARIESEMQCPARARADLDRALALDAGNVPADLVLADLDRAAGDPGAAAARLEERLSRPIDDPRQKRDLLEALQRARAAQERLQALEAAAEAAPGDPDAATALAAFLAGEGAHLAAASRYTAAAESAAAAEPPRDPDRFRFRAGLELLAARREADAIEIFAALAREATDPDLRDRALFDLGVAQASAGLDAEAGATFRDYLDRRPRDLEAHLYLGNALMRLGRDAEARREYQTYLDGAGSAPEAEGVRRLMAGLPAPGGAGAP